jgi:secondary thiamine-phosphate synthase enzyme
MAMQQVLEQLAFETHGQGFTRLDPQLNQWLTTTGIDTGVLHLTCLHTSCSLTINENADPRVLEDLAAWMEAVVPQDGHGPVTANGQRHRYRHDDEGRDDMPAHIRTALTAQTMTLSVQGGRLLLGIWQAVYLWEHRAMPHRRRIACHLVGERTTERTVPASEASQANLLQRRNGRKLNEVVLSRHQPDAWAEDGGIETDVDLLIDRLHEIAEAPPE